MFVCMWGGAAYLREGPEILTCTRKADCAVWNESYEQTIKGCYAPWVGRDYAGVDDEQFRLSWTAGLSGEEGWM